MLFDKLSEQLKEYPKLNDVCLAMKREGFFITDISTVAVAPEEELDYTRIEVGMENQEGERILILFMEGIVDSLTVEEGVPRKEKIHPNILFNKETIRNKTFKKKVFGGYNDDEVDTFLDSVYRDYRFIEETLIKENKRLKEDLKTLRRH